MAEFFTVIHDVANYDVWRAGYDADAPNRAAAGLTDLLVVRDAALSNRIALLFGMADREAVRAMTASPQMRAAMQAAGVIGTPMYRMRVGEFTPVAAENYLTLNCSIEGIERFRKAFAMDADQRVEAGITDLGVMLAANDPQDLLLIFSFTDRQRCAAFLARPELAEHQVQNAGVMSPPQLRYWKAS